MRYEFDIDEKLTELLLTHNVFKYDTEDILGLGERRCDYCSERSEKCVIDTKMKAIINKLVSEIPEDAVIAIRGGGLHTNKLLDIISAENKNKIRYVFDRYVKKSDFGGIEALRLEEMSEKHMDFFIISSYDFRIEMKEDLIERGYAEESIIDIYESLANNGIYFYNPFYLNNHICKTKAIKKILNHGNAYDDIITALVCYEDSLYVNDDSITQILLYELILHYIYIKDFVNAKKYMNIYIDNKYRDYSIFQNFSEALDGLLTEIKHRIASKISDNIIVFMHDSLENSFIEYMPYLKKLKEVSVVFENAFTQYPQTRQSTQILFTGKDLLDDKLYEVDSITYENSKLLGILRDNGYKLYCMGLVPELFRSSNELSDKKYKVMTEKYWLLMQLLANNDSKGFYLLHFLETHIPFLCGYSRKHLGKLGNRVNLETSRSQEHEIPLRLLKTLAYSDAQFKFYSGLIHNDNIKIIMSDHGVYIGNIRSVSLNKMKGRKIRERRNIVLFAHSGKIEPKVYNGFLAIKYFNELILHLIKQGDISAVIKDYVSLQEIPIYDKIFLDDLIEYNYPLPLPARKILTINEQYAIDYNGVEKYLVLESNGSCKNRINEPACKERIDELRELCGSDFGNIFEHPFFEDTKDTYKKLGYIK